MNRRQFSGVVTRAALTAASYGRVLGANDRLNFALVGTGRRGRQVAKAMLQTGETRVSCLCDIYDVHRTESRKALKLGPETGECAAQEEALARPDVDAVVLTVPDHLHVSLGKAALAAAKHLYLEKPCTHSFDEAAELLQAVKASGKVCQVGTQQRSGAHYRQAKEEYFDKGKLGKVVFVRAVWNNFPWQARHVEPGPQPANLDWNRFLGDAPKVEWSLFRYDSWRCFPDYGAGVMADILNHWADVAQWMLDDQFPVDAVTTGGIYQLRDGRGNPDTVNALIRYKKDWNLAFESSVLPVGDDRASVMFLGTQGTLDLARSGFTFRPAKGAPVVVKAEEDLDVAHARNFVAAVKSGAALNAPIEVGLRGVVPCHMATQAYWSGRRMHYDPANVEIAEA